MGLPSIGGGRKPFGGLGGVYGRAGAFDIDPQALERANAELNKLNKIADYENLNNEEEKKEDGRTMLQVMMDKRKKAEAENAKL